MATGIQRTPATTFGARNSNVRNIRGDNNDRPKAQFWLNVGYMAGEGEDARFVSLAQGIPLDGMDDLPTDRGDISFRQFQQSRNDLRHELLAEATKLEPGQDIVLPCEGTDLAIQIRRVEMKEELPAADANPWARSTKLINIEKAA